MNWKVLAIGGLPVTLLVVVLAANMGREPRYVSNNLEGDCPRLEGSLETLDGTTVPIDNLQGSPLILNFWSTYCVSCEVEHEDLMETRRLYQGRGVQFFGVMWHDEISRARAWLAASESSGRENFPILVDPGDRLAIELGVSGVPETFVVDAEGCLMRKFTGPVTVDMLANALEPLL